MAPGIFEFTARDLQANRSGHLSPAQQQWLDMTAEGVRRASRSMWLTVPIFVLFGGTIIAVLFAQNASTRHALTSSSINLVAIGGAAGLVLLILIVGQLVNTRTAARLERARILTAEGAIRFGHSSSGSSAVTSYYVYVGRKRFSFAEEMDSTFQEHERYRVYYCKAGPYLIIMSFERISV